MVDPNPTREDKSVQALLDWLSSYKGFYNKLTLLSANSACWVPEALHFSSLCVRH